MKFHKESGGIDLTVTELLEIAYPLGDIRSGFSSAPRVSVVARTRFLELYGREDDFQADVETFDAVTISRDDIKESAHFCEEGTDLSSYPIHLRGKIDGVSRRSGEPTVLYFLVPTGGYDAGGRFRARFRAKNRALGALYVRSSGEDLVDLVSVTIDQNSKKVLCEREACTANQLNEALLSLVRSVIPTTDFLVRHKTVTLPKAGDVLFPYHELRDGQEKLIRAVYRSMRIGSRLFVEAPTGIGKTISTLYPAVRALGNGHVDKIFYLTAKASTRREVFSAAGKLFHAGARLRTCIISAKDQVCLSEKMRTGDRGCNPFDCPYADGYYERAPKAILSLLRKQNGYTTASIMEAAREYRVCPYELSLDLSEKCDIVICDYNYIFDPRVYFRRYFGEDRTFDGRYAFLIDEGHNLPDRVRDMYSGSLRKNTAERLISEIPEGEMLLKGIVNRYLEGFSDLRALCADTLQRTLSGEETGFYMSKEAPRFFDALLEKTADALQDFLRNRRTSDIKKAVEDLYTEIRFYRLLRSYYNEKFLTMVRVREGDVEARIFCLDPSEILGECLSRARSSVVFSATLTPLDYFIDLCGGFKKAETLSLPSPFPRENLCVAICDSISTRFEDRKASYRKIAAMIAATASGKVGNYMVYFPSYEYLSSVAKVFREKYPRVQLILQKRGMNPLERDAFLDSFRDDGQLRIGFSVLGGSFSEGVDLPGKQLIGSVIVGVGLAGLSEEGNILRDYYENKCERGYDYAYTFPGMNRILQAAGRVIRTETDKGVVVLIDDRYAQPLYRSLFPPHWDGLQCAGNSPSLAEIVRRFWGKVQE